MLIRIGYDIELALPAPVSIVAMLQVHSSRASDLRWSDLPNLDPSMPLTSFIDSFGNRPSRIQAPAGNLRLSCSALIEDSGQPQAEDPAAFEHPVEQLPNEALQFLLSSRYCEVDRLSAAAYDLFGSLPRGWGRVAAICDWIHARVEFGYNYASPTRTAEGILMERKGVCRDFQHLAITFCRALHIPARYVAGYLGDIDVPPATTPMDFSAWIEVYLANRWWVFDARHRQPRIGRIPIAIGRDAADAAITTSFGQADLRSFRVITVEEPVPVIYNEGATSDMKRPDHK